MKNNTIGDLNVVDLIIAGIVLNKKPYEIKNSLHNFAEKYGIFIKNVKNFLQNIPLIIDYFKNEHHREILKAGWILTKFVEENTNVMNLTLTDLNDYQRINGIYSELLTKRKFINLERMIMRWDKNVAFNQRYKIIYDGFLLLKKHYKDVDINIYNYLLPVLFAQIDGICYSNLKNLGYNNHGTRVHNKHGKAVNKWSWLNEFKKSDGYNDIIHTFIRDILFGYNKNDINKIYNASGVYNTYSRNKIIHGEELNYGTLENTLRTYLVLDFLFEITNNDPKIHN